MVINNFDIIHIAAFPFKTDSPLIIYSNAVLSPPVTFQSFKLIAWRLSEVLKGPGAVQIKQLPTRLPFERLKTSNPIIIKESGGVSTSE
jgi:hypothetical protein